MVTLNRLLRAYDISIDDVRLVRHSNSEIQVLDTFRDYRERFEAYQAFQRVNAFRNARHIIAFCAAQGRASLLLGMWTIEGETQPGQLNSDQIALIKRHQFPDKWQNETTFYQLRWNPILSDLSERVVIDWGGAPINYIQAASDGNDKPVLEIRPRESIGAFTSFADVRLGFAELQRMMANPDANQSWRHALSAVRGIYLIREVTTGLLYVGSAYGVGGIYGRWNDYANNGHGGNVMLEGRDPKHFEFSILEVISPTTLDSVIIDIEGQWKARLGTRENGHLNSAETARR